MHIKFLEITIASFCKYLQLLQIRTTNKRFFTLFYFEHYKTNHNRVLLIVKFCNMVLIDKNYPKK